MMDTLTFTVTNIVDIHAVQYARQVETKFIIVDTQVIAAANGTSVRVTMMPLRETTHA